MDHVSKKDLLNRVQQLTEQVKNLTDEKLRRSRANQPALEKSREYGRKAQQDSADQRAIEF